MNYQTQTKVESNSNQKHVFHIQGMHCNACVLLTESELGDLSHVTSAKANLSNHTLEVEGDFGGKIPEQIAAELTIILKPRGYSVSVEKQQRAVNWSDFKIAIPVAAGFAILFIVLQKIGLINMVNAGNVTYGTAFAIGIVASLSSCMAVVGGLLLSMSATFAKEDDASSPQNSYDPITTHQIAIQGKPQRASKIKPQLMFHVGRIVSFFIFGGIIGMLGSAFTLNATMTFVLGVAIAVVMLILGINLLDVFPWVKKLQPSMPRFIAKYAHGISKLNHTLTPLLVGVATFFLPCGFTQSMQLYALSTGSFLSGSLIMLAFALGTLPVLALVSFSSFNIENSPKSGIFFKSAGLIVILFAIFNLLTSLIAIGFIPPILNL